MRTRLYIIAAMLMILPSVVSARLLAALDFEIGVTGDSLGRYEGHVIGYPRRVPGHDSGGSLMLHGTDCVVVGEGTDFNMESHLTVSAWILVNKFDNICAGIVTKGEFCWKLERDDLNSHLRFVCAGLETSNLSSRDGTPNGCVRGQIDVDDGRWHHVVGTYDGTAIALYVDGRLDKAISVTGGKIRRSQYQVCIGGNTTITERKFHGQIDDVAIFDHGMSGEEVEKLFQNGIRSYYPACHCSQYVRNVERKISNLNNTDAILEIHLAIKDYPQWVSTQKPDIGRACDVRPPSDLWGLLAIKLADAGESKSKILEAYQHSLLWVSDTSSYASKALIWLHQHVSDGEFKAIVMELCRTTYVPSMSIHKISSNLCLDSHWPVLKSFLDVALSDECPSKLPTWVIADIVRDSLQSDESCQKRFLEYCRKSPTLADYYFRTDLEQIRQHLSQANFLQAAECYLAMSQRCENKAKVNEFNLEACRYLLESGDLKATINLADSIMNETRSSFGSIHLKAKLLQAMAYLKLGQFAQSNILFSEIFMEYPESSDAIKASYYLGYCAMLEGNYSEANKIFKLHKQIYPHSPHIKDIEMYIARIADM